MEALQLTEQYLTFRINTDLFAVDVGKAREILDLVEVTRVPQVPEYMLGVINLRGSVVPVINLRRKFGMGDGEETVDTCIIVMEVDVKETSVVIGVVADAVQEVLDLSPEQIEPPPRLGTRLNTDFIKGMGNLDGQFIMILDIDRVFSIEELDVIGQEEAPDSDES